MNRGWFFCLVLLTVLVVPSGAVLATTPEAGVASSTGQATQFQGMLLLPIFDGLATKMQYDIVTVDLATKERKTLLNNASQPSFSHDGKSIAYKSWVEDQNVYGLHTAVLNNIAGTDWRFSNSIAAQRPNWAPNDSFFYFHSRHESDRLDRIMVTQGPQATAVFRPDMDNKEVLGKSPAVVLIDKTYAVLYQGCEFSKCGIWRRMLRGADGTDPAQITEEPTDQALSASPDGKWVAFMSYNRDGAKDWELYVMAADGSKIKRLTNRPGIDGLPTWSSDGNWLAFVRETAPNNNVWDVMAIQPDGTGEQKLVELGALNGQVRGTTPDQCLGWMEEQIGWLGGAVKAAPTGAAPAATKPAATAPAGTPEKVALTGFMVFPIFDSLATRQTYDVVMVDLATMKQKRILENTSQPALSHDGTWLAYKSWSEDRKMQGLHAAALADIAGTDWQFSPFKEAQRPSWVPDDLFFSFYSRQESDRIDRVMVTKGPQPSTILRPDMDNKEIMGKTPVVFIDKKGDYLLYQGCEVTKCGVWSRALSGGSSHQITEDTTDQAFSESPDGQWLAFMSYNREGAKDWEVYVMSPDGSKMKRLTNRPGNDGLPTWSPDGKWIAFVRETKPASNVWDVMAVKPDGTGEQKMFQLGALDGRVKGATPDQCMGWVEEQISWGAKLPQ